ncbi:hypothetical protein JX265_009503 [Neoarthrinium moseri]|uniref:Uncharacterized protein n=1 Tax=Neoarthrinium moseri TaxID=1658444 RepID=A0A9P9WG16_9PEZI|nr:hypothetical protein JX265_009503 [Neoarthrinium moseri]
MLFTEEKEMVQEIQKMDDATIREELKKHASMSMYEYEKVLKSLLAMVATWETVLTIQGWHNTFILEPEEIKVPHISNGLSQREYLMVLRAVARRSGMGLYDKPSAHDQGGALIPQSAVSICQSAKRQHKENNSTPDLDRKAEPEVEHQMRQNETGIMGVF